MAIELQLPAGFHEDAGGKLWITPNRCFEDIWGAAAELKAFEDRFEHVFCLAHRGYVTGAIIGACFENAQVQSVNVLRDKEKGEINVSFPPKLLESGGMGVLIIDGLIDSGDTMRGIRRLLPKAFLATVYAKLDTPSRVVNYHFRQLPQKWIVFPWDAPTSNFRAG